METKKYQLPKEFAAKWVAALRSGEYKQTIGSYYNPETHCYCGLGVSLAVLGAKRIGALHVDLGDVVWPVITGQETDDLKNQIMDLNDVKGYSFEQQADWIETNVEFI